MEQKTVFISYRRSLSKHLARSIYLDLKNNGWDVFLDVNTIDSGDFDRIILNQIAARAHFILVISPGSMERCVNADDWLLREIQEAVRLERNIVPIIEEGADFTREIGYLPSALRDVVSKKNSVRLIHDYFDEGVERLRARFLKTPEYITITEAPPAEAAEVQLRLTAVDTPIANLGIVHILPAPFAWIEISGKGYDIAKYPVTNAQYAKFIEAGGYQERKWWTDEGWDYRKREKWTEPRYWNDNQLSEREQPVVGVSWYEAIAFCAWLSDMTRKKITLPTEDQWQYAAQGDDGRIYPWGNEWDANRCNNRVHGTGIGKTTPVRHYGGKGDSAFGVVDMAGNVWEWCLTDYNNSINDNNNAKYRVLRGGSWGNDELINFRCDSRIGLVPNSWSYLRGFRLART